MFDVDGMQQEKAVRRAQAKEPSLSEAQRLKLAVEEHDYRTKLLK